MEGRLFLDVVVGEGTAVLKLLSSEDQTLLVWWNSLLVLDLGLDVVDGIGRLDLESDGLASDCEGMSDNVVMKSPGCGKAKPSRRENLRVLTKICILSL